MNFKRHPLIQKTAAIGSLLLLIAVAATTQPVNAQVDLVRNAITKIGKKKADPKPNAQRPATSEAVDEAVFGGRVVFSREPIDPANPTNLTSSFNAGDHIYGAILLDYSFREFVTDQYVRNRSTGSMVTRPGFEVDFLMDDTGVFDGKTKFVFQLNTRDGALMAVPNENFLIFDISPDPAKVKTYGYEKLHFPQLSAVGRKTNKAKAGAQFYSFRLSQLKPGEHTVKLVVMGKEKLVGEFRISGSSYAFYAANADKLDSAAASNTSMPKSQWNNAAVLRSVRTAFRPTRGESVLRVVLVSPSWFIQKNNFGQIMYRGLFAAIATRRADGTCFVQREYFKQNYSRGRYGRTLQSGRSETKQPIPCKNVR